MEHPERRADETRDEPVDAPRGEELDRPRGEERDWTDGHVERWRPVRPQLDPDIEGAVTRMTKLLRHLGRVREQGLADYGLQKHEFDTLHVLAGRGGRAVPSDLRDDLGLAPASVTGRLEALERRGFIVRTPSTEDRRRVDVELTEAGRAAWGRHWTWSAGRSAACWGFWRPTNAADSPTCCAGSSWRRRPRARVAPGQGGRRPTRERSWPKRSRPAPGRTGGGRRGRRRRGRPCRRSSGIRAGCAQDGVVCRGQCRAGPANRSMAANTAALMAGLPV